MLMLNKTDNNSTSRTTEVEGMSEAKSLPCLNSNISTDHAVKLSTQHKKTAFLLTQTVSNFISEFGLENCGFLTLTFAQHIVCAKEAQKRLNSLFSHVIKPRYGEYVGVFERQKSGRIHYHLLVSLKGDIRTGFNFQDIAKHDYSTANTYLRGEWAFWRKTAKKYGFGRTELLPVKSNAEGIGKYVGKYIAKHTEHRDWRDKGVRLVRYSSGARIGTTRFQFVSKGSAEWRSKVAKFAEIASELFGEPIKNLDDLSAIVGKRWAYQWREEILNIDLTKDYSKELELKKA